MMKYISKTSIFSLAAFALAVVAADPAFAQNLTSRGGECATGTVGAMICNFINNTYSAPGIITGFSYMAGLIAGFMGIMKLKDHVENPNHVSFWEPVKRFVAGGAFFLLPWVADVVQNTIEGPNGYDTTNNGFNGTSSGAGLDAMIVRLMSNVLEPTIWAVGWVGWIAGLILVFIGISRLLKAEQDGPRGPAGIGTVMTFLIAGCLFSLNSIITFINTSIFQTNAIQTNATLQYVQGLNGSEAHVHAVISAIIGFSILIGWISVARGLFIVRGVSEGNSQASMMAAITHLIGGVLAINLGGVIMAVQNTLNITTYGIRFGTGG
jgi:hypothetical protein